ncbi:MAG: carboxypeptidase regulatory-like domain-containing protein [Treponema sp.]|jgi:hypothetical protein|nr:carboxypeptidase regulatory-like domain-containing protein [Treponema sp.]
MKKKKWNWLGYAVLAGIVLSGCVNELSSPAGMENPPLAPAESLEDTAGGYSVSGVIRLWKPRSGINPSAALVQIKEKDSDYAVAEGVRPDKNGAYTITGIPPGEYRIEASLEGYDLRELPLTVSSDTGGADLILPPLLRPLAAAGLGNNDYFLTSGEGLLLCGTQISSDWGETWTSLFEIGSESYIWGAWNGYAGTYAAGRFIIGGDADEIGFYTPSTGEIARPAQFFEPETPSPPFSRVNTMSVMYRLTGIAAGNGVIVAGAYTSLGTSNLSYSTDNGDHWTVLPLTEPSLGRSIYALVYEGGRFVAAGGNSASAQGYIAWSSNGRNWTQTEVTDVFGAPVRSLAYGGGRFVACSNITPYTSYKLQPKPHIGGVIAWSDDGGQTWNPVDLKGVFGEEGNEWIADVCYGDGVFVAMGGGKDTGLTTIAWSADGGETWNRVEQSVFFGRLGKVTYAGGRFFFLINGRMAWFE